ncbi:MAG: septum formation protein [Elusimicrobia bacterium]|nr:MAG: septum formation protein [Elusimicrobiota bacterium]KAF0154949.1 MAG: septum formation protein [Elusimicrobiota bacterium]
MKRPVLVLASRSPRRVKLLREAGIKFVRRPSSCPETHTLRRPSAIVKALALEKAMDVAKRFPDSPVLGSDTLVFCRGKILGKPRSHAESMRLLRLQNGSWQAVYSGVALVWLEKGLVLTGLEKSRCKVRRLSPARLEALGGKHMDKAGAYAVQDAEDEFVERVDGRFDTVVGLPMNLVKKFMKRAGLR